MLDEQLMGVAARLATSLEALAALAAHIRIETEGLEPEPEVRALLQEIATALVGDGASFDHAQPIVGLTQTLLGQAAELVARPDRPGGWVHTDERLLQGTGRMSMAIAPVITHVAEQLDGLAARLSAPDAAFLDVGTGAGWLAIALAKMHPGLRVVGIDIFDPALELAQRNREATGLDARIELRRQDVTTLDEEAVYDAVWLPLPFLPRAVVLPAIAAAARALRPGGWLIPGLYGGPPDELSQLICDLRTVRSGGHAWGVDELVGELDAHGLNGGREIARHWKAPVRLFAAQRPAE